MVTLVNRAKMTIVSTGTGPLTLGSAVNGYQSFVAAGVSTGDVVRYIIEDGDAWEIGLGTYSANTSSLSRSVSESSNAGAPIALSGKAIVFLGLSAADINARVEITDPRLSDAREWSAGTITQAEAEAGTATTRRAFTAQRIHQAILGWWNGSSDKTKLDGIAAGAQVNVATNLGIIGTGNTRTITSSTGSDVAIPVATTTTAGLMTTGDKSKLDGIAAGAQVNVAANLTYSTAASSGTINSSTGTNATIPAATTSLAGLLTGADKTKLDGVAAGAQVNIPTNLSVTGGTTAGPSINSSTGTNVILPTADGTVSGVVTTGAQTFAGVKSFSSTITGSISGNAGTATTLQTARSINGTNFNGSTAITTANWGTARTLTIGSTGKNVNGSGNVGWTLAEIGAAAAAHSHSEATTSAGGFMSSSDKAKLDGIAAGAQVNVATNLGVSGGTTAGPIITSSTGSSVTLPSASTTASGVVTTGAQSWAGAKTFTGVVTAPDFVTTSDARLKTSVTPITDALAKLHCLNGVTFQMEGDPRQRIGLLAQEVQAVAPEAVIETEGVLRLAYGNLIGLLVEAIKDLSLQVDQLKRTKP